MCLVSVRSQLTSLWWFAGQGLHIWTPDCLCIGIGISYQLRPMRWSCASGVSGARPGATDLLMGFLGQGLQIWLHSGLQHNESNTISLDRWQK